MKAALTYLVILLSVCVKAQQQVVIDTLVHAEDSARIKAWRLQLNTNGSEFAPQLIGNTLYFSSDRAHTYGVIYAGEQGQSITDIFYAQKTDSVNFKRARALDGINSKYNEGPFTMSKAGDRVYFSTNDRSGPRHQQQTLKIYSAAKTGDKWQKPEMMPFCEGPGAYCHPALVNDSVLIFASDRPGGLGGMDLYVTECRHGKWSAPTNLGNTINSSGHDVFPFVSKCGLLYFSSKRAKGLGGLDFYVVDLKDPLDAELVHLQEPFNSEADDFGIWADSSGASGYFSSNRNAATGDDIYYFHTAIPDFSACSTPSVKNKFCYTFFEESTMGTADTSNMTYEWDFGDGHKARRLEAKHCYDKPGIYHVQLNVVESNSGELFYNETSYDMPVDTPAQLWIVCTDTCRVGEALWLDAARSSLEGYSIGRHYWAFGDGTYNSGPRTKHIYRASGCYTVELGVLAKNEATGKIEKFRLQRKIVVRDHT